MLIDEDIESGKEISKQLSDNSKPQITSLQWSTSIRNLSVTRLSSYWSSSNLLTTTSTVSTQGNSLNGFKKFDKKVFLN